MALGHFYSTGSYRNLQKATEHYILSAKQGHPAAYQKLKVLEQMSGTHKAPINTYFQELSSILLEEESHNPITQYKLGVLYEEGIGVKQDQEKAFAFYEKAASQNLPEALYKMGGFMKTDFVTN